MTTNPPPGAHRTVTRVTTILEAVGTSKDGVRLSTLVSSLGAPKSSVHGLVRGLIADGYLLEDRGLYTLGPAVSLLLTAAGPPITVVARRVMDRLRDACGETVLLSSRLGDSLVYVAAAESTRDIRFSTALNIRRPLYPTSSGKCFLAFAPGAKADRLVQARVHSEGLDAARRELATIAATKVAFNRGETEAGVYGAASPIMVRGEPVACLAVAGPSSRMETSLQDIGHQVVSAAREISERLASER